MLMLYVELLKLGMIQFTVTKWKLLFLPTYYLHDNKRTVIPNCVYMYVSVLEMIPCSVVCLQSKSLFVRFRV